MAAQMADAGELRRAECQRAQRGDRGRDLARGGEVGVDAAHLAGAGHGHDAVLKRARGAHALEKLREQGAGLGGRQPASPGMRTVPPADERGRHERARIGQVGLHPNLVKVKGAGVDHPRALVRLVDAHARGAQGLARHVDVRQARQHLARVAHREAAGKARRDEQERGHELGRCRGVDVHRVGHRGRRGDGERQGAAPVVVDASAEGPQRRR